MPNKTKKPNLAAKYIEEIRDLTNGPGSYAYRGQEDAEWPVESSASRRIRNTWGTPQNNFPDIETFIRYHENDLLAPARMDGYGTQGGRRLRDLELLAELQHFGAATCLIDFTTSFLAALWFACRETVGEENKDGMVFVLNISNSSIFRPVGQSDLENDIRPIIKMENVMVPESPAYWHWSPHGMNSRILKQDSLFVFGKANVSRIHLGYISISGNDKADLLRELDYLGVSGKSLFKDLPGFASMNGHNNPIPTLKASPQGLFLAGKSAYRQGDPERAIRFYDDANSRGFDQKAELLFHRGNANARMKKFGLAIQDYTQATAFDQNNFRIYLNRGSAQFLRGNLEDAVSDFTEASNKNPKSATIYFRRALAYEKLQNIEKMLNDLNRALELAKQAENNALIQNIQEKLAEYEEPRDDIPF